MRIKYGGTTIDLKLASSKVWALCMLIMFVFLTFFYLRDLKRRNMRRLRKPYPVWNDEFEAKWQLNDASDVRPPGARPLRFDDELNDVTMAMHAVRDSYPKVLELQQTILRSQDRPDDRHYNINVTLSDSLSMDRVVKDTRPPVCRTMHYDLATLPKASVIIPFYNEALSMLLRTVHSILNNSPDSLLNEIILVDDASTREYLKDSFEKYLKLLPKVRIIRNTERLGLIVSRLIGSRSAKGPVVVFLDAHTEANVGWLEPMLDDLQRHPASVIQPFVDGIDKDTIDYTSPPALFKGAFSWDMG